MFLGIPHFPQFRDLGDLVQSELQIQRTNNIQHVKDSLNIKTSDGEETHINKIRSLKIPRNREQVSFQEGILDQHFKTFKTQVEKYINSIFGRQKISTKTLKTEELFAKKQKVILQTKLLQYYLCSHFCNLQYKKAQIFKEDLQCEQKLKLFLLFVCQNSCHQVAGELLLIANQVWQEYVQIQDNELSFKQLIEYSKYSCQRIKKKLQNYKNLKYITMETSKVPAKKSKQNIINCLTQFIQYFTTTIFLVASQYYLNPYQQKQQKQSLKRNIFFIEGNVFDQFSDFEQEEQGHLYGRKINKS